MLNVQELTKTELHCHLDGSLSLSAIRQLSQLAEISIPDKDEELRKLVSIEGKVDSLMTYLKTFDFVRPLLQTEEALELAAYDVLGQAAEDGVIYIELRFAPELSTDKDLTILEAVNAVLRGMEKGQKEFGIVAKLWPWVSSGLDTERLLAVNLKLFRLLSKAEQRLRCA